MLHLILKLIHEALSVKISSSTQALHSVLDVLTLIKGTLYLHLKDSIAFHL